MASQTLQLMEWLAIQDIAYLENEAQFFHEIKNSSIVRQRLYFLKLHFLAKVTFKRS